MKNLFVLGLVVAVGIGMLIGSQATLTTRSTTLVGPVKTGLLMTLGSGVVGVVAVLTMLGWGRQAVWVAPPNVLTMMFVAGALGVAVVIGMGFALQQVGVTAGLAAILMGQMMVSVVTDAFGWGTGEVIPVTPTRVLGLVMLAGAIFFLLPRR